MYTRNKLGLQIAKDMNTQVYITPRLSFNAELQKANKRVHSTSCTHRVGNKSPSSVITQYFLFWK